jgi:predicted component of type VI protein secretion system
VTGIGDRELQWQDRILIEDIYEAFSRRVLTEDGIKADFRALVKPMLDLGINGANEWQAGKYDFADARKAMIEAMEPRLKARHADCQDALDELCATASIDHQWVADLEIDARCAELGIKGSGGFEISLGKTDFVRIFPAFGARLVDEEAVRRVAKDPLLFEQLQMPESTGSDSTKSPSPAGDEAVPNDVLREDLADWLTAIQGYGQLPNARGVFVWRGTKRSAARASREVARAIRTGVMTGWLAASGDEHVISFVGDANYDPYELNWDKVSYLGGAVREGVQAQSIDSFPETFPIAQFLQTSINGMCDVATESTKSYRFVAGALRLLGDCDAMLSSFPAQAFVAAMSAVEACVGGKGSDLAKTVARRCGRLLVDDLRLRASADQLLSDLYDHRSRIVHGEQCDTSTKDAVLMRYVASCVVFNCAGLARAMGRLDDDAGAKSVIRALDQDNYGQSLMPGVTRSSYLLRILSEGYRFANRG